MTDTTDGLAELATDPLIWPETIAFIEGFTEWRTSVEARLAALEKNAAVNAQAQGLPWHA